MTETLFPVAASDVALTTDEWYTPRWLFKTAGLTFDMDVCAPVDPAFRTCPAREYLTVLDDGLTAPWSGLIWCNPPYSRAAPWVDRLSVHPDWLALVRPTPENPWLGRLLRAGDATTFPTVIFGRPDGSTARLFWPSLLVARGSHGVQGLAQVASACPVMAGAYHVKPMAELIKAHQP